MNPWIWEYVDDNVAHTADSGTIYIDLPQNEQISMLMLELRVQNSSDAYPLHSIFDCFSKISVVADGVKTLFECTAEIADFLAFVHQDGKACRHVLNDVDSGVSVLSMPIYFGRQPFDTEYFLDTGKYRSVQVQVTYSDSSTYITTASVKHTLTYARPLTKLTWRGMIRSRLVRQEASSAAAIVRHDLPTQYPWYLVAVRMDDHDADISGNITNVDLNVDSGRLHIVNVHTYELMVLANQKFPNPGSPFIRYYPDGNEETHTFGAWPRQYSLQLDAGAGHFLGISSLTGEKFMLSPIDNDGDVITTDIAIVATWNSPMPHQCLILFDGRKQTFDAPSHSQAWIDYTTGSNTQTIYTILQEVITRPL